MSRIGVFVCHCGHNIAGTVDVSKVVEEIQKNGDVAFSIDYKYMCSDPGQALIRESIEKYQLDGVVVAACSPAMHETTFRRTVASAGLNGFRCESANIREQCSWVHQSEPEKATAKAIAISSSIVEKVKTNEELESLTLPLTKRLIVIGGGIAGMQSALDVADAGYPVVLVEKENVLGGNMNRLSGTYLNFAAAPDLLQKKIDQVLHHPHIQVMTGAEVTEIEGYVGNFKVKVGQKDDAGSCETFTFETGALVVATGWRQFDINRLPQYAGGSAPDVIDALTFESMLAPGQKIRRPSDGKTPYEVVFVQCAGSREKDAELGVPYCSKACCMVVAKQAMLFQERVPGGQAYVFYTDIRSAGKGYDEYVQRAMTDHHVLYLRGKVSKIFQDKAKLIVWGEDSLSNQEVEVPADLVVLASPMAPQLDSTELAQRLHISTDANGFYNEAHPKLRPVETLTAGIYLAGTGQGPKDIPETVAQASGAAAKVLQLFSHDEMTASPLVATVIPEFCSACGLCVEICPYGARSIHPLWNIATVNAALCQSCGACAAGCPNKASQVHNWRPEQIMGMIDTL